MSSKAANTASAAAAASATSSETESEFQDIGVPYHQTANDTLGKIATTTTGAIGSSSSGNNNNNSGSGGSAGAGAGAGGNSNGNKNSIHNNSNNNITSPTSRTNSFSYNNNNNDINNNNNNNNARNNGITFVGKNLLKYIPHLQISYDKMHRYFFTTEKGSFRTTIRNPLVFCGPGYFSRPTTMKDVWDRITNNFKYYLANYLILAGLFAMFTVITSPIALIGLALILLFWIYAMKEDALSIGGKFSIRGKYKTLLVMCIITVAMIMLGILDAVLYGGFIALIVSALHMIFHQPMITNRGDMLNDIENEDEDELGLTDPIATIDGLGIMKDWNDNTGV